MATRALGSGVSRANPDWRATLRRSLRRSAELGGATLLFAAMIFLILALVSYHQTDPSTSTAAADGEVRNWMGPVGAWLAERALFLFGPVSALFLPLLYVFARRLWRLVEEEDGEIEVSHQRWWRPIGVLIFAMALLSTVLSLAFTQPGGTLPASMGGISGLLGAKAIRAAAALLPEAAQGWTILALAIACLCAGAVLASRVFAVSWGALFTLPGMLRGRRALPAPDGLAFAPDGLRDAGRDSGREKKQRTAPAPFVAEETRRAPEITDPSHAPRPAQLGAQSRQGDLFDKFELPGLDLLSDPPPNTQQKIDKLSLERNARLLETVLDDFNVKGEITAVRTGPVVTMYELEPAPGIKASRVIGLADDIARNMSAISARVSAIPGRTVMGIELPNAIARWWRCRSLSPARLSPPARRCCRSSWARTLQVNRSSPIWPQCRTCWSPAPPDRASRSASTASCCRCSIA